MKSQNIPFVCAAIKGKHTETSIKYFTESQNDIPPENIAEYAKKYLVQAGIDEIYEPELVTKLINILDLREV